MSDVPFGVRTQGVLDTPTADKIHAAARVLVDARGGSYGIATIAIQLSAVLDILADTAGTVRVREVLVRTCDDVLSRAPDGA